MTAWSDCMRLLWSSVFACSILFCETATADNTTVFGLALDQPISIEECPTYGSMTLRYSAVVKEPCLQNQDGPSTNGALKNGYFRLVFPVVGKPSIIGSHPRVLLVEGQFVRIDFDTRGVVDQFIVMDALTAKFGKPAKSSVEKVTAVSGASFDSIYAAWEKPGVEAVLFGTMDRVDTGFVFIQSPAGKAAADEISRRTVQPVPAL